MKKFKLLPATLLGCLLISCTHEPPVEEAVREPSASRPAKVLFVGDSLALTRIGDYIDIQARKAGYDLSFYANCGSKPSNWSGQAHYVSQCGYRVHTSDKDINNEWSKFNPPKQETPLMAKLLSQHKPDVVIIQLGNNLLENYLDNTVAGANSANAKQISALLNIVMHNPNGPSAKRCIWMSPPDTSKFSEAIESALDEVIRRETKAAGCVMVRSKEYTNYGSGGDGEHYYGRERSRQAERLGDVVMQTLKKLAP